MFRKTFIRLIIAILIASTSLIVFAANRAEDPNSEACSGNNEDCNTDKSKGDFLILESLGRTVVSAANY